MGSRLPPDDDDMQPIQLFDLASRKSEWLATRQATIAGNIANANTPGYRAKDVAAFADVLATTRLDLASTDPGHLPISGFDGAGDASMREADVVEVTEAGNSVGVEEEMMKAGEVNRDYALTTNIVKSFHNLLMASVKP